MPALQGGKPTNGFALFQRDPAGQIAAVLTYIRNSFGKAAPAVSAEQVKALRDEAGKAPLNPMELKTP